jgi:hypothetical protein
LTLLSLSLFGVLVAFVATGGIVAVWRRHRHRHHHCHQRHHHRCHRPFFPVTISLAAIVVTLGFIAAWFSLSSSQFGVIIAVVAIVAVIAIVSVVAVVAIIAVALFAPVAITLAAVIIPLAVVTTNVLAVAAALVPSWLLCPSSPSSLGEVSVITLVALTLIALDPLAFFVALIANVFTALAIAIHQCPLSAANACPPAAHTSSADAGATAASLLPVESLLPLVALYFIMADCYIVPSTPAPSSHCCSHRHHCHRFVIVTAHPHLWRNPFRRRTRQKKSIFIYGTTNWKKRIWTKFLASPDLEGLLTKTKKELQQSPIPYFSW